MKNKIDLVNDAFSMLLRTGVTVKATNADIELALGRLEDVMSELESRNLATGYNFENPPQPDSPSGLEDYMNLAVSRLLAVNVWPDFSPEEVNPMLLMQSAQSQSNLSARLAQQNMLKYAKRMPLGSGNQPYQQYQKFYGDYSADCGTGCSSPSIAPAPPTPPPFDSDAIVVDNLKLLASESTSDATGKAFFVTSFYAGWSTPSGGGWFAWSAATSKALHNGVTVYAHEALTEWSGAQSDIATLLNWTGSGGGCWLRVGVSEVMFEMAGAVFDANPVTGSGTDNTLSVNKTFLTGMPVFFSKGHCKLTGQVNMLSRQVMRGAGRTASMFVIGTDFNLSADCVLRLGTSEPGAQISDVGFSFVQADQGVRANCTQYPWAIDASNMPRFILDNIRIEGAWNGVNATGNTGGASVGFLEIGALNIGFDVDGALDFFHVETLHFWPFGISTKTTLLNSVYYDGIGTSLKFGLCDGADFGTVSMFRTKMEITSNATSGISNSFERIQLDGDGAGLKISGGVNSISQVYSTKSSLNTVKSIDVVGGVTTVADLQLLGSNPEVDVAVSSGSLLVNGGSAIWSAASVPRMTVTAGTLNVGGFRIKNTPSQAYTVPFVRQSSNGRLVFKNNSFDEKTTGSGVAIEYNADNAGNYCLNNRLSGYTTTNPIAASLGVYQGVVSYTPVIIGATVAGVGTYSVQDGKYTFMDDRTILFSASVTWSAHTGSGGTRISLPHTLADFGARVPLSIYYQDLAVGASKQLTAFVGTSGTVLALRASDPAGGVVAEFFDTAGTINISGFYRRA